MLQHRGWVLLTAGTRGFASRGGKRSVKNKSMKNKWQRKSQLTQQPHQKHQPSQRVATTSVPPAATTAISSHISKSEGPIVLYEPAGSWRLPRATNFAALVTQSLGTASCYSYLCSTEVVFTGAVNIEGIAMAVLQSIALHRTVVALSSHFVRKLVYIPATSEAPAATEITRCGALWLPRKTQLTPDELRVHAPKLFMDTTFANIYNREVRCTVVSVCIL